MKYTTTLPLSHYPKTYNKDSPREVLQYAISGMLYMPATKQIAYKLLNQEHNIKTICLDLEDSLGDSASNEGINSIVNTLSELKNGEDKEKIPLVFIRPKNAKQAEEVYNKLKEKDLVSQLTGFNFPKFDSSNAGEYKNLILKLNHDSKTPIYCNPIIETERVMNKRTRISELDTISSQLKFISNYILNVRVGATDFSNLFGVRRSVTQNIYDINVLADCLSDVVNFFGSDYVLSGPVWEYFNTEEALKGLEKELELDKLNGFIGKTSIHPSQLQLIYDSNIIKNEDYQDALSILGMNENIIGVQSGVNHNKMNEVKTHINWAKKVICLAEVYGVHK